MDRNEKKKSRLNISRYFKKGKANKDDIISNPSSRFSSCCSELSPNSSNRFLHRQFSNRSNLCDESPSEYFSSARDHFFPQQSPNSCYECPSQNFSSTSREHLFPQQSSHSIVQPINQHYFVDYPRNTSEINEIRRRHEGDLADPLQSATELFSDDNPNNCSVM
ncbi:hypothetical protein VNO77_39225 [Canavalia gladiata]|uniref:Uncharacterized protein n=1 Tax=Canavalia gladiata TaxID=3824 RepID=A0AAN9KDA4_CANGL